ncbi:MAG: response regulator [Anaerolineales bacterium]|jgi:DNA-binding response OmpR family regulator
MAKILIIEDAPESAKLAQRILVNQDYEVLLAATGDEGLKLALEYQPDMILLDLGLPDINADAIAGQLQQEENLYFTPVIVVSAWPEYEIRRIIKDYGFREYIKKPFDVDSFIRTIRSHLV